MHRGNLVYSIKYDLGGAIDADSQSDALVAALRESFGEIKTKDDDLAVFNFSYLSRTHPIYEIQSRRFKFGDQEWSEKVEFDPAGIVTVWLTAPEVEAESPAEMAKKLLDINDAFVADKNRDYLMYLDGHNELRGRLKNSNVPSEEGSITLRHIVEDVRACVSEFVGQRVRYNFHDYRPVFIVDDACFCDEGLRRSLLSMCVKTDQPDLPNAELDNLACNDRFAGNTWAFICRRGAWTGALIKMLSHAHSSWFQIHGSIFEMKDIEDLMNRRLNSDEDDVSEDTSEFLSYLSARKNVMFSEMFSALSSDFITKNSQCRDDLDLFMNQFGVKRQIEILKEYTERISSYLREYNEHHSLIQTRNLARNTRILEILFLLNTIAGIAGFAPALFSTDINSTIVWDLPRLIAVSTIVLSLIFYVSVILVGRFLRKRHRHSRAVEADWLEKLEVT